MGGPGAGIAEGQRGTKMERVGVRAALLGLAGMALAGCAGTDKFIPSTESVSSTFGNLLAFNTTKPGSVPAAAHPGEDPLQCPTIEVLDGTSSYRTFAGADQTNENVRYQFSMGDIARDCTRSGNEILLKVGAEGRVLLGPAGSPGSFKVPVRIAVRRDSDQKPAAAKLYQVPTTIAPGETAGSFTIVSDPIAVPFLHAHADDDYTILVGFDAAGKADTVASQKGRHARSKPPQG